MQASLPSVSTSSSANTSAQQPHSSTAAGQGEVTSLAVTILQIPQEGSQNSAGKSMDDFNVTTLPEDQGRQPDNSEKLESSLLSTLVREGDRPGRIQAKKELEKRTGLLGNFTFAEIVGRIPEGTESTTLRDFEEYLRSYSEDISKLKHSEAEEHMHKNNSILYELLQSRTESIVNTPLEAALEYCSSVYLGSDEKMPNDVLDWMILSKRETIPEVEDDSSEELDDREDSDSDRDPVSDQVCSDSSDEETAVGVSSTLFAGKPVPTDKQIQALIKKLGIDESLLNVVGLEQVSAAGIRVDRRDWDYAYEFSDVLLRQNGHILFSEKQKEQVNSVLMRDHPGLMKWLKVLQERQGKASNNKALQLVCLWQDWWLFYCYKKEKGNYEGLSSDFALAHFDWRTRSKELVRQMQSKRAGGSVENESHGSNPVKRKRLERANLHLLTENERLNKELDKIKKDNARKSKQIKKLQAENKKLTAFKARWKEMVAQFRGEASASLRIF